MTTSRSSSKSVWTASDLARDPHAAPDKSSRIRRMFGAIARSYDLNNRLHSFGRDQAWRRTVVRMSGVRPTDRVLDVACGTGDLALLFARTGVKRVVGLDFTPQMLEVARRKVSEVNRPPEFVQGDAQALPFEDGSFDVVSIAFGLRNVEDPARALREFHRVLTPPPENGEGRLAILEFSEPENPMLRALNRFYTKQLMPLTATLLAGDRTGAYRYLPRSVETFARADELAELVGRAGFEIVQQKPLTFGVCTVTLAEKRG